MTTTAIRLGSFRSGFIGLGTLVFLVHASCGSGDPKDKKPDSGIPSAEVQRDANPNVDLLGVQPTEDDSASGSVACNAVADCAAEGACPLDAVKGCTCVTMPKGKNCLPKCLSTSDCPKPTDQTLACSAAGLCIPASKITIDAGSRSRSATGDTRVASSDVTSQPMADAAAPTEVAPPDTDG